jgi:hypothetical protein
MCLEKRNDNSGLTERGRKRGSARPAAGRFVDNTIDSAGS